MSTLVCGAAGGCTAPLHERPAPALSSALRTALGPVGECAVFEMRYAFDDRAALALARERERGQQQERARDAMAARGARRGRAKRAAVSRELCGPPEARVA